MTVRVIGERAKKRGYPKWKDGGKRHSTQDCRLGLQEGRRKVEKEGREQRNGGRKEDEE